MRSMVLACCVVATWCPLPPAPGQDGEITIKGKFTCAKCELLKEPRCTTVMIVKEGNRSLVYYCNDKLHKELHGRICQGPKNGTVTGTLSTTTMIDKDTKATITKRTILVKKYAFE